jgi:hypothetical protein
MQYGANGDLFENLENLRKEHILNQTQSNDSNQPPKNRIIGSKRASIKLDQMFYKESAGELGGTDSVQRNPLQEESERGSGGSGNDNDDGDRDRDGANSSDRDRERSTINWSSEPRLRFSTRIARTLESVTGSSRNNMASTSAFEPLICMHQVL